jgi:dTDP-4-amino-4,6-dideoxygalactose transaminase
MVVTNDDQAAERIRLLRSHGMTTLSYDRYRGHAQDYDVLAVGYNYRSDDIHSAIGLVQLARLEGFHTQRRAVYRWYIEAFRGSSVIVPFASRDLGVASPHIMSVVVAKDAEKIRERLRAEGIQTSRHYPLVGSFSVYRGARGDTPRAASLRLVTLPFGQKLTREQVQTIAALAA